MAKEFIDSIVWYKLHNIELLLDLIQFLGCTIQVCEILVIELMNVNHEEGSHKDRPVEWKKLR